MLTTPAANPTVREGTLTLARANARFWPTVAPLLGRELRRAGRDAEAIDDDGLRALALSKLADESFNAEVAATLATLAPRRVRAQSVRAIVAFELLFDYLDGRTELPVADPLAEGARLFGPFVDALRGRTAVPPPAARGADARDGDALYVDELGERVRVNLVGLPSIEAIGPVAIEAATRCAAAQTHLHAAAGSSDPELEVWAREVASGSELGWREHLAGSASSVLAVHALIALAANEQASHEDAVRTDAAYLAIGGVITVLDSLVDAAGDKARGEPGFILLYASHAELIESLRVLIREALARARAAPFAAHHMMTLAGVVAYYTSDPGAREPDARAVVAAVRRELAPTIWPALAVMHAWRTAKQLRRRVHGAIRGRGGAP